LRKNAILQIVEILRRFGTFQNSSSNINKYGTEVEMYLMRKMQIDG